MSTLWTDILSLRLPSGTGRGGHPKVYHTAAGRPSDDRIAEDQIAQFAKAGADIITVHIEPCPHIHRVIQLIRIRE